MVQLDSNSQLKGDPYAISVRQAPCASGVKTISPLYNTYWDSEDISFKSPGPHGVVYVILSFSLRIITEREGLANAKTERKKHESTKRYSK